MLNRNIATRTVKKSIADGIYSCFSFYVAGQNEETNKYIYHWRYYITTDNTHYITSSQQQHFTVSDIEVYYSSILKETIATAQSSTFNINMDINDELDIAQGVFETADTQFRFNVSTIFSGAVVVDVDGETSTEINKTVNIIDYKYTNLNFNFSMKYEDVAAYFVSFDNFNDEENPPLKYYGTRSTALSYTTLTISLDGYTEHINRTLHTSMNYALHEYTIEFTYEERNIIREYMWNKTNQSVYIYLTSHNNNDESVYFHRNGIKRTLSIINGNPVLTPYIEDTNATTLALTGDSSTIIRFHSNAYVNSNVEWQKAALEQSSLIQCGSKSVSASEGILEAVESNQFVFSATDSRGLTTTVEAFPPYIDYIKLSSYIEYSPVEADTGTLKFSIRGNYYNGSFGAVDNGLGVVYRIKTIEEETWGEWVTVSSAEISGHTYKADVTINNLDYRITYQLQSMATDKLNVITSVIYTLTTIPVYDWSKTDFNFNVPVNFSASVAFQDGVNAPMRFDDTADFKEAVTFANTADFNAETSFNAAVSFASVPTIGQYALNDYVIESGTEEMGSNGVWYWRKWASGRAECWGRRNFGNMGFGTALGNSFSGLYQSQEFMQTFPAIFGSTPDVINIDIIKSNSGAWILRGFDTSADAYNTGSFALAKAGNADLTQVYLGFYVCGTWIEEE